MKITAIKGYPLRFGIRNQFVVKIETDGGIYGLGEGGMSGRELAMQGMLEHLSRFLIGEDPGRIEHIWQTCYRGAYFEGGKILGAVISAIDIALWDILGKSLDVPVYQLLGGACRQRVPCFCTPGELNSLEIVEQARAFAAGGWKVHRYILAMPGAEGNLEDGAIFEPLEAIEQGVHWLREIRKAVGPGIQLAAECHHRLSVAEAAYFAQQAADVHLYFIEEPIRTESPAAYRQLRAMTPTPFAVGEEFSSKWAFAPFIEEGLTNFARTDLSNVGGLTEARKVAGWCEAHYIDVMPHNPLGPVTTAASIHHAISTPNFACLEYQHQLADSFPHDLFPTMPVLDGVEFALPTAAGLGVTMDETAAERYAFEFWEAPHWRRRDGSYTNW